jgi:MFS family permease
MSPDSALQRRTLSVLVIMQVIGTVGVGVAPSIGVLLAEQVTDNEAWAGLARTASTLGAALLGLPLGRLAANRGRRVALSTGWFSAAAGAALLIFAAQESEVVTLFIGLLLIGAGSAVSLQSRFAATDLSDPRHRGRHLALVVWVGTLGSVIGPNLGVPGEVLHAATGLSVFAGAFLVAAVCLALAGVVAFLFLRPDPLLTARSAVAITMPDAPGAASVVTPPTPSGTVGASRRPTGVRRKGALRHMLSEVRVNADARLALTAVLTAQVVMVAVMTMTPVHMEHQGGTVTFVGLTISLHVAGMYGLSPVSGWAADRWGPRTGMWIGICIFVASLLAGAFFSHSTGWIIVCLILLGLGWSFTNVAGSALFTSAVSEQTRAASQGGLDSLANLCAAVAAFGAGPLLAVTSFSTLAWVAVAVLVPLVLALALHGQPPADAHA